MEQIVMLYRLEFVYQNICELALEVFDGIQP